MIRLHNPFGSRGLLGCLVLSLAAVLVPLPATGSPSYIETLIEEAEQGKSRAQFLLGLHYEAGDRVPQDYAEAVKWWRLAAKQGNPLAWPRLGYAYEYGQGVLQDHVEAVKWYRLAATRGYPQAQINLGSAYQYGKGVPQDHVEAVKWYRLAAEQGYPLAQWSLGLAYARGEGVPQDNAEAVKWYRLAAQQGLDGAQISLGASYASGRGVPQDSREALKWFRLAAEQGVADAQGRLGFAYAVGEGVPQDHAEAVKWYRLAAQQGNVLSQQMLAAFYAMGKGVPQNYGEAYIWFSIAVASGSSSDNTTDSRDAAGARLTPAGLEAAQHEADRRFNAIVQRQAAGTAKPEQRAPSSGRSVLGEVDTFRIAGIIGNGDVGRLDDRIRNGRVRVVEFDSQGGSLGAAMVIGRMIRENLLRTEVPYGAECHSACVIAFVGGVERRAVGALGVHSFYSEDILGSGDFADASELYDQVSDLLEAYLKEMRIPLALLDHMKRVSHEEMEILTAEQKKEYFLEGTDPVYRQTHGR